MVDYLLVNIYVLDGCFHVYYTAVITSIGAEVSTCRAPCCRCEQSPFSPGSGTLFRGAGEISFNQRPGNRKDV
jgi:hypothetical protein